MVMSLIGLGVDVDGGTVVAGDNLRRKLVGGDGCVFDGVRRCCRWWDGGGGGQAKGFHFVIHLDRSSGSSKCLLVLHSQNATARETTLAAKERFEFCDSGGPHATHQQ